MTNINILYNTQKIGAAGSAIDFGSLFVKGAFARDMMYVDMSERAPSIWTSDDISAAGAEAMRAEVGWQESEIANTTLDHVLNDAKDPGDDTICIALTCDIGPMLMVRLGVPDNGPNSIAPHCAPAQCNPKQTASHMHCFSPVICNVFSLDPGENDLEVGRARPRGMSRKGA